MAKQTAIFWGMSFRQWCFFSGGMAAFTEPFRLFFLHGHEPLMVVVMGERPCGLWRRGQQKIEYKTAQHNKEQVIEQMLGFGGHNAYEG
jgi:hypothetical protein